MTMIKRGLFKRSMVKVGAAITTIVCAFTLGAIPAQAVNTQTVNLQTVTDTYLFNTSLAKFTQIRATHPYDNQLDWSTDYCSYSPDRPLGYDFTSACSRHDFGYRNYKRQGRFTEVSRKRIDDQLYADLKLTCAGSLSCDGTAWIYYRAVRTFGS